LKSLAGGTAKRACNKGRLSDARSQQQEYHQMIEAVAIVMGLACVAIFVAFAVEAYLMAGN
jgi:hypothetical protein